MSQAIRSLLSPKSIAVLGASADFDKLNGRTVQMLIEKRYPGAVYPVNPKYDRIGELRCYPNVAAIDGEIDLAIVTVPARHVPNAIRELGARKVSAAIVFSSGFSENGPAGVELERQLAAAIRESGVRVMGPNCLGLVNAFDKVMATFSQFALGPIATGPAAFVTQSGALGTATTGVARRRGLNFGYFVNTGNELDVTLVEVMREVLADPRVTALCGYIEGLKDGPGLCQLGEAALAAGKPIALTKVGRTRAGARAIASHTGSLAGEDAVFSGVIGQMGFLRARSDEHLLDITEAFVHCPLPRGNGIALITRSGGAGALMADRAEELGLDVARFSEATAAALLKVVPQFGAVGNPVDITAQGLVDPSIMRDSMRIALADPNVHIAVVWLAFTEKHADITVDTFAEVKAQTDKPFIVSWVGCPDHALQKLRERGIAVLRGAEPAVDAAHALVRYAEMRRTWLADRDARAAIRLPRLDLPTGGGIVPTLRAAEVLHGCGVELAPVRLARSAEEAVAHAATLGFPVALKIESPDIAHKTEAQGVALGLGDAGAVRSAFETVNANARRYRGDARIEGVIVQPMTQGAVELVIGLQNDPVFGTVVMAGLGGIFVEVLKDVAFRKAPVTEAEALRMLADLRGRALLDGVRGKPPVDRASLARLIAAVSRFGAAAGPRLREFDLNPVLAGPAGAVAVDWLMLLEPA